MSVDSAAETILILAPGGLDAGAFASMLEGRRLRPVVCDDIAMLALRIGDAAGAVLITEQALAGADAQPLIDALQAQPDWSHVPFLFLLGESGCDAGGRRLLLPPISNVMLLQRPLHADCLFGALECALQLRRRQFLIRNQIEALSRHAVLLRHNEEALEESRAYLRDVLDSAQEGFFAIDPQGRITVCNVAFRRMLGLADAHEVVGAVVHDMIHHSRPDGAPYEAADCPIYQTALYGAPCHVSGEMFFRADGTCFPVDYRAQPVHRGGALVGAVCTFTDITERLRAEQALRTANERFSLVLNSGAILGSWIWEMPPERFTGDERLAQSVGLDAGRLAAGVPFREVEAWIHPEDRRRVAAAIRAAMRDGGAYRSEYRVRHPQGGWRWVEANGMVSRASATANAGAPLRFPGVLLDISERKRIEAALRESDLELRTIADSLPFLIAYIGRDLIYRFANRAYQDWFYLPPREVVGRHVGDIVGADGMALREAAFERVLAGEPVTLELHWPHRDGRRREAEARYMPRRDAHGAVVGFHVFVIDVTERAIAAETLRDAAEVLEQRVAQRTLALSTEIAERQKAEEALRQSQKMEAVGQLTGGIAHDFNNMLTGIIGSMELMKRRLEKGEVAGLERFMEAASASAQRAAALTHRLLAFSRRQSLDSRPIDVNALVLSLEDLLARTIGEHVTLRVRLDPGLRHAQADTNQLESALLNLAINARDAMPQGGELSIETAMLDHAEPEASPRHDTGEGLAAGCYVTLTVVDSGFGMTSDVLARAFEPFYTTKPLGQGTGLGLSMIYGFARQSGGAVRIRSSPGEGTSVRLCLPVAVGQGVEADLSLTKGATQLADGRQGAGESVLVVEDDPQVRLLVLEALSELGYAVIQAPDAAAAITLLESSRRIDLLVTDVGLPGMNGRQLAEIARQRRPGLGVLFMTGYAENAAIRSGFLAEGMQMITKPFALEKMASVIREMMTLDVSKGEPLPRLEAGFGAARAASETGAPERR